MNKERLKEFISVLRGKTTLKSEELLEKDLYISALLGRIASEEYAFKGGTCLSKVYLEYHRISEDIDLTFINQGAFSGKSTKQVKKVCKEKTALFGSMLENVAKESGFDFRFQKSNKKYVDLGSNSKLATFKVWYRSVVTGTESFIKVQITFLEAIKYPVKEKMALPLIQADAFSETDRTYFSDYVGLCRPLKLRVYDVREIASEKIRALLTRKSIKARDIVDLYCIEKAHKINAAALKEVCIEKTMFAISSYEKYRKNIMEKADAYEKGAVLDNAEHLMNIKIDKKDFDIFTKRLFAFLEEVKMVVLKAERR